ncbi:tartrate-resistant acid phosphatase type 5-like [Styela clava]
MLRLVVYMAIFVGVNCRLMNRKPEAIRLESAPTTLIQREFSGDSISFLIAGDNGGFPEPFYSTKLQRNVAALMARESKDNDCKFILELGDNFYFLGVKDIHDKRWKGTFEDVYNDPALYIPWYITTGNHDWHGSVQAQIDYSKISTRWTMPWYWYTLDFTMPDIGVKLRIIMFETTIPCGIGGAPDGVAIDDAMAEEEWAWLETQLQEGQDADYLIVTGHYPVYSAGNAGPYIECLYNRLEPLLDTYRVSAYIAGHDHDAQHLIPKDSEVHYIVVGCSNFITPWFAHADSEYFTAEFLFASWMDILTGCFARVDVDGTSMRVTILDGKEGNEMYTAALPRRDKTLLF